MKTKERIKTILLIVLVCGAAFLTYSIWFYDNPIGENVLYRLFVKRDVYQFDNGSADDEALGELEFEVHPLRMTAKTDAGRYGLAYNQDTTDRLYQKIKILLAEAISTADKPQPCSQKDWLEALEKKGMFFDYEGIIPMDSIAGWEGAETDVHFNVRCRYVFLRADEKQIRIYMKDPYTGDIYVSNTGLRNSILLNEMKNLSSDNCRFAFEKKEDMYRKVEPENLIFNEQVPVSIINGYNLVPFLSPDQHAAFLKNFGLNPYTCRQYIEKDGTKVYVEALNTVKVAEDGFVTYTDNRLGEDTQLGIYVSSISEEPTEIEILETARSLMSKMAGLVPGGGRLYMQDFKFFEQKEDYVALFGWSFQGVPIDRQKTGYCARVVIHGKKVTEASFYMRSYEQAGAQASVLPQKLVIAAMNGSGQYGEIGLRYTDAGQSGITPEWYVKER